MPPGPACAPSIAHETTSLHDGAGVGNCRQSSTKLLTPRDSSHRVKTAISGRFVDCCARATSGHAAVPATSARKSRRFISPPCSSAERGLPVFSARRIGLLHRNRPTWARAALGSRSDGFWCPNQGHCLFSCDLTSRRSVPDYFWRAVR
jgi:hypothetical protein